MQNQYKFLEIFEEILGLNLTIDKNGQIMAVNLPLVISKIYPESVKNIINPIQELLNDSNLDKQLIEPIFLKKILSTKYIYNLIDPLASLSNLDAFIEKLQILGNKTYEQDQCKMGFILFKNKNENIKDELEKLEMDFIPFKTALKIEELDKIKSALKIVDSLSVSYIVDANYKVIGLAKKKKSKSSISSIMSNRYQKENEYLLKFNLQKYFIKNFSTNETKRDQINELDQEISILKEKNYKLELQINPLKKEIEHIINDNQNPELLLEEITNLFKEKNKNLDKIEELLNIQIELLENEKNILTSHKKMLNKFLAEKVSKTNKNIQFVQLNSNKIEWFINDSIICTLSNGKWHIKNFELISHIILEFIIRQSMGTNNISEEKFIRLLDKSTSHFHILFNNIKNLSKKNIGALIIFLERTNSNTSTIYKDLLNKGKLDDNIYKNLIKTEKNKPLNIYSCDNFLFELICSVDGAVILDRQYNILGFGEMINNSLNTPPVSEAGSRTLAAAKASLYGLSIKVSEDGDISIFENGSPIIKL